MLHNAKQVAHATEVQYKYRYGLLIIVLHYKQQNAQLLFAEVNFNQVNRTVKFKLIKRASVHEHGAHVPMTEFMAVSNTAQYRTVGTPL
jgi:hypothetical protein